MSEELNNRSKKALLQALGIFMLLFLLHQRGKANDETGRFIRNLEGWVLAAMLWSLLVCSVFAFMQTFGISVNMHVVMAFTVFPFVLPFLRWLFSGPLGKLFVLIIIMGLLLRLLAILLDGAPLSSF